MFACGERTFAHGERTFVNQNEASRTTFGALLSENSVKKSSANVPQRLAKDENAFAKVFDRLAKVHFWFAKLLERSRRSDRNAQNLQKAPKRVFHVGSAFGAHVARNARATGAPGTLVRMVRSRAGVLVATLEVDAARYCRAAG